MKYLIITGNPKQDGLCSSITGKIRKGAEDGGAEVQILETLGTESCKVCGNGWGTCLEKHMCFFGGNNENKFNVMQEAVKNADCLCIISPVYWGEMSECLKNFLDRLRRCEFGSNGALSGKQVLLVASPGGSGNGALTCLEQFDRFCRHTGAVIFDCIGISRWNNDYKGVAAYYAARAMAENRKAGETV